MMKEHFYSGERNVQIVISLLKSYGIRKIIASPGTTNASLVASLQQDSFFEIFSSVDERSAAYMACGLAAELQEPVVLSCTGATASRNYYPGLTEAFYRKLQVIAITSTQPQELIGHNVAQVIDRRSIANDIAICSENLQNIKDDTDEWDCTIKVNRALHAMRRNRGPVHFNLETTYSNDFSIKELPQTRHIEFISSGDAFPEMPSGRKAIFIGAHLPMSRSLMEAIDGFCRANDAVAFCDCTSNYYGRYRVNGCIIASQDNYRSPLFDVDLLIHIGDISGDYEQTGRISAKNVWRVNPDGQLRDTFRKAEKVFELNEETFFRKYGSETGGQDGFLKDWHTELEKVSLPEIAFSNIWIAGATSRRLPEGSTLHLGILNTLRSWNFCDVPASVTCFANTGGFGIDGGISTLTGASLGNKDKLYFGIFGDLSFFYDLNSMGNRHIGNNVRIMLINNGKGVEFRNPYHRCSEFGEEADPYMAAAGHYGNRSRNLVRHYAEDLGYEYISASNKEEFSESAGRFLTPEMADRPIIFECFTCTEDERSALSTIHNLLRDNGMIIRKNLMKTIRAAAPDKIVQAAKTLLK